MKLTIGTGYQLQEIMYHAGRDYYSPAGYDALLEYYDSCDPDTEVDPVAICCDCTEYGDGAACSISDMIADYGHLISDTINDDILQADYLEILVDALNDRTTVLELCNDNYIVFAS